jgi:dTDP-4-amino-4,6-dideoxygalactose transaminase
MTEGNIPLVDLGLQHRRVAEEVSRGFDRVLERTAFILGPEVEAFEREYAQYCDVAHCVGVGNGTDALELAIRACDIGAGDEIIIPANTFIATAEAVVRAGATVVLADCGDDYLIDPARVADVITPRTKAIMPVHLYGQMAPMKDLQGLLPSGVHIIEDAAQSQGASQLGARSGSIGSAAATSFYPGKNLGAYGDAGAVTTGDDEIAERLRLLRNHGSRIRYEHIEVGMNSRLDGLQAVVLSAKLSRLDEWNGERAAAAARYNELLAGFEQVITPTIADGNTHVWHLYVIRVGDRDRVVKELNAQGVGAAIHYPTPIHQLEAFAGFGFDASAYPRATAYAPEIMSLPIYPGITEAQQQRVVDTLRDVLRAG